MALLDFILDRTGAIGARIRGYRLEAERDRAIMRRPRPPTHTTIITSEGYSGKQLSFDAATDIRHEFSSKVTSYPVEDKSTVSDHVVNENPRFTVSGVFSDAMLGVDPNISPNRWKQSEVYQILMKIRDDRKPVTLVTPLNIFSDLIVTNISIPRSTGQGDALFIDVEFEKIRRVSSELSTVFVGSSATSTNGDTNPTPATGTTATNAATERDAGAQQAEERKTDGDRLVDQGVEFLGTIIEATGQIYGK